MWPFHPELLTRPVPRYTSYPTAAELRDGIDQRDVATAMAEIAADAPLSLYVHIPYCRDICWYCGCNTGAANRTSRLLAYLEALDAEVDLVAERLGGRGRIGRIAFGGGSPNAIEPLSLVRLIDRLVTRFDAADAELSIELDPRGLNAGWTALLGEVGIRRASLGVQTFADHVQRAIGRIQPVEMISTAVERLRLAGVASINFDLMYGLPGQSIGDIDDTLDRALALSPDRIAMFGYAHLPQLLARQRRIDEALLPDLRLRFDQAARAHERLVMAGYQAIGFDHFALPTDSLAIAAREGKLRRNFQGFTDDSCETLIGLGASAISQYPGLIAQNEKMAGRYRMLVMAGHLPPRRGVYRSAEDRLRGAAIERLLCDGSVELGADLFRHAQHALGHLIDAGLVRSEGWRITIDPTGLPYRRVIASSLDAYRTSSTGMFSGAV